MMRRLAPIALTILVLATAPAAAQSERYRARRERLLAELGDGALVAIGAAPTEILAGDKDFFYLTGLRSDPAVLLAARKDGEVREVLFLPARNPHRERWDDVRLFPGPAATTETGIETRPIGELGAVLVEWKAAAKTFHVARAGLTGTQSIGLLDEVLPGSTDPTPAIHQLRLVKDAGELELLRRAVDLTGNGIVEALRAARPGMYEYELQALGEFLWRRGGAEREGFDSILGSGPNACVLHYRANRRQTAEGDIVVMDVGAEVGGYTADVTRTFPVNGKFTDRQREVYGLVLEAQKAGIALCRPGKRVADVHNAAWFVLAEAGVADHFWHGTSHWLGLDVHDAGDYDTPFAPGMVVTVEPGLYFPDESLGVRIEDDVLITDGDPVVLSGGIPSTIEGIEAEMAKEGMFR